MNCSRCGDYGDHTLTTGDTVCVACLKESEAPYITEINLGEYLGEGFDPPAGDYIGPNDRGEFYPEEL